MNKAIFLDRDGVINKEIGTYVSKVSDFEVEEGVIASLQQLKKRGFVLIVITNQAGIAKGLYRHEDVVKIHAHFQTLSQEVIDAFYYSPYHPDYSASLGRKPGSLLFEKAINKFDIEVGKSWMIGDRERDLIPAKKMGINTIILGEVVTPEADWSAKNFQEITSIIG